MQDQTSPIEKHSFFRLKIFNLNKIDIFNPLDWRYQSSRLKFSITNKTDPSKSNTKIEKK